MSKANNDKKEKTITGRVFAFSQNEYNHKRNQSLNFNEENIKNCISHKTIKEWTYIKHDKDVYTLEDIKKLMKVYSAITERTGDPKPVHLQIVLTISNTGKPNLLIL